MHTFKKSFCERSCAPGMCADSCIKAIALTSMLDSLATFVRLTLLYRTVHKIRDPFMSTFVPLLSDHAFLPGDCDVPR